MFRETLGRSTNACRATVFVGCCLAAASAWAGPKVDGLQLKNGDHLTCEIKKLEQGALTISTDPLDTVTVHWAEVTNLTSPREFEVTLQSGERFYGSLSGPMPGALTVTAADGSNLVFQLAEVTGLVPIGASLWSRMDGNIDLGFSFAQANLETHWTLNAATTYRSSRHLITTSYASQLTARQDVADTSRNSFTTSANRLFSNQWFATALVQLQQNGELALDLRSVTGGGAGKTLSQTNHRNIALFLGLVYTHEQFTSQPHDNSAEAALGGQVNFFTSGTKDFQLDNSFVSYYDVTGRGRVRLEVQSAWRHEFWKDVYYAMNGYESFDSDPPENEKKNDASISLSLGWKF